MLPIDIRTMTNSAPAHPHSHRGGAQDYSRNPMLVYWEMTQACPLACRHCRAEAVSTAHPEELTHSESLSLLQQIASFDVKPHLILTGGDPATGYLRDHRRGAQARADRFGDSCGDTRTDSGCVEEAEGAWDR
jgi:2-iminoacetate synthase ThiH